MCNHAAKLVILAAWWRLQDDGPSDLLIQIETSNSVRQDMATRGEIGDQNVGTGVFQYGECDCMRRKVENEADCGDICVCAHQFILSKIDPVARHTGTLHGEPSAAAAAL